jgi:hypothetical protein
MPWADERNEPTYNPRLHAVQKRTGGPVGPGTRFTAASDFLGRDAGMSTGLTAYDRPGGWP